MLTDGSVDSKIGVLLNYGTYGEDNDYTFVEVYKEAFTLQAISVSVKRNHVEIQYKRL